MLNDSEIRINPFGTRLTLAPTVYRVELPFGLVELEPYESRREKGYLVRLLGSETRVFADSPAEALREAKAIFARIVEATEIAFERGFILE